MKNEYCKQRCDRHSTIATNVYLGKLPLLVVLTVLVELVIQCQCHHLTVLCHVHQNTH